MAIRHVKTPVNDFILFTSEPNLNYVEYATFVLVLFFLILNLFHIFCKRFSK